MISDVLAPLDVWCEPPGAGHWWMSVAESGECGHRAVSVSRWVCRRHGRAGIWSLAVTRCTGHVTRVIILHTWRVWSVNYKWCCKVVWRMWFYDQRENPDNLLQVHRIDRDIVRIHVFGKIMRVLFWRETVTWPLPRLGLLVSEKTVRGP